MQTARRIQTSILPGTHPDVPGLDIACRYEPMTEVAGDYYDYIVSAEGCLGILVADVSGHGVPAALIASMVKVAFMVQSEQLKDPARILSGMNKILFGLLEGQFVTAGYAFIDPNAGRLVYSGAGHPPLLIRRKDGGEIVRLERNGLMLGPFPDAAYESTNHDINPGDRIVMYTDGIVEATKGEGEQFGEARLESHLAESEILEAREFADDLLNKVADWEGRERGDDLTLIVIDILPEATA
jgi:serine phosphatase RsbU (regulator of sigma subunit)